MAADKSKIEGIEKPVVFITRFGNLKLVMDTPHQKFNGTFVEHVQGKIIQFQDGKYETNDSDEINFIRNHRWFDIDIHEMVPSATEGFTGTINFTGEGIEAPCGYDGCDYVAKGATLEEAVKKLNAHKTRKGHH